MMEWLASKRAVIIPGVMKGGTCSMRAQLQALEKPLRLSLPTQEPHFFDNDEEFALGASHYAKWFDWNCEMIGDVTPSYMYLPKALLRLRQYLPQAKLIVLLRNPIGRAVSHHNHDLSKCRKVGSLEERWTREMLQAAAEPSRSDAFRRGFYSEQLERILQHYPKEQVLVLISERCRQDPLQHLKLVANFLGLQEVPWLSPHIFAEQHVRKWYWEEPSHHLREKLQHFYGREVQRLRGLLGDALPEWDNDFRLPSVVPQHPWLRTVQPRADEAPLRDRRWSKRSETLRGQQRKKISKRLQ